METEKKEGHHSNPVHHKKNVSKKLNLGNVFVGLGLLLCIMLIVNVILTSKLSLQLKKNIQETQEKLRPAKIEIVAIKNSKCTDCFDISTIVNHVKSSNVNVTKETALEFNSKEAKELENKYKIEKIPALVVTGEIEKVNIQGLVKKENAMLLSAINPPYTNAASGKIEGRVILFVLKDSKCEKCNDLKTFVNQIKSSGIKIGEEKDIDKNSDVGEEIIKKYNIEFVPTLVMSKDASAYDIMQKAWLQVGTKESDGSYILRVAYPPFINLTTNKLRGIVNVIYLNDTSCADCYNVNVHKEILTSPQSFAMHLDKEETVDIRDSKGKELIAKYNISQVPTVIMSEETSAYPSSQALKQFFSIENDGSYIFRKLSVLGNYKDLTTNEVVKAKQQSQDSPV